MIRACWQPKGRGFAFRHNSGYGFTFFGGGVENGAPPLCLMMLVMKSHPIVTDLLLFASMVAIPVYKPRDKTCTEHYRYVYKLNEFIIYHETNTCSLYLYTCSPIYIIRRKIYVVYKQLFNCSWRKATTAEDQVSYIMSHFFWRIHSVLIALKFHTLRLTLIKG